MKLLKSFLNNKNFLKINKNYMESTGNDMVNNSTTNTSGGSSLKMLANKDRFVLTTEEVEVFNSYAQKFSGKKIVCTHSGAFHADEVLATMMTKYASEFMDSWIVRTRNYDIHKKADLVCDVGGIFDPSTNRFDHHMKEFTHTFDDILKIKMSSAGLVYKYLGKDILANVLKSMGNDLYEKNKDNMDLIYNKVYVNFIAFVDGADNGINQYPDDVQPKYPNTTNFNSRISRTNPEWNEENADQSSRFQIAQDIAEDEFLHQVKFVTKSYIPAYSIVKDAVKNRKNIHHSGRIIFLEKSCPWKELLYTIEEELDIKGEILFAIYGVNEREFRIQTVPLSLGNFRFRKGLLEDWRGTERETLSKISGIEDIVFVHSSGFIGGAKSFKSAIKMAEESLKNI